MMFITKRGLPNHMHVIDTTSEHLLPNSLFILVLPVRAFIPVIRYLVFKRDLFLHRTAVDMIFVLVFIFSCEIVCIGRRRVP